MKQIYAILLISLLILISAALLAYGQYILGLIVLVNCLIVINNVLTDAFKVTNTLLYN